MVYDLCVLFLLGDKVFGYQIMVLALLRDLMGTFVVLEVAYPMF